MKVKIKIVPRKQFRAYLKRVARWACLVVHRRGGKTFCCIQDLIHRANTHQRPGPPLRYAYIAPTRDQAKDIAWAYLVRYASKIPGIEINKSELTLGLPDKWTIRLYSGDNYERMRGLYFDGVVIDESGDIDPRAWDEVIRPCLTDYKGWATFIGTPKGKNSFFDTHKKAEENEDGNWFSLILRASESGIIDPEELRDIRASTPEPIYLQEWECDFAIALQGAIYAAALAKIRAKDQIGPLPHDAGLPVWTFWDLGSPRNTAVWSVQFLRNEIKVLHCDTATDWTTAQRVAAMTARGYDYAGHCIPHDGAAIQKSGITYQQELEVAGLHNVRTLPRTSDPTARIHRIISLIPAMSFDAKGCKLGLKAMEEYHTAYDAKKKMFSDKPYHDWTSHPCDALGYMAEAIDCGLVKYGGSNHGQGRLISPIPGLGDPETWHGIVISPLG